MARRDYSIMCKVCAGIACILALGSTAWAVNAETTLVSSLDSKDADRTETSVGSLVADAYRSAMNADVAFLSAGDLKPSSQSIVAGKVQSRDVAAMLAYPDEKLVVLALDGRKIRAALERSVSNYPRPGLNFLQLSGCQVVFDPSKPEGSRITSLFVAGKPIVDEQAYKVAVPNSLASGAVGYWKIWSRRNIISKDSQSVSCTDAIDRYFVTNKKLNYATLKRVTATK